MKQGENHARFVTKNNIEIGYCLGFADKIKSKILFFLRKSIVHGFDKNIA